MKKEIEALYNTICDELKDGWKENSIGSFKDFIEGRCQLLKELIDTYYAYHEWKEGHAFKEGHEFPEKEGTYMSVSMDDNDWDHTCKHCQERVLPTSTGQYYCPNCNGFVEAIRDPSIKKNPKCPDCGGNTHSLQSVGKPNWYQCDTCENYTFEWTPT